MGMDVSGRKPTSEKGEYFRNNVWWWHPLANYIEEAAPEIASRCQYWHTNDGDGLGKRDSIRLAEILETEVSSGRTAAYATQYAARLAALPDEPCDICGGTGKRRPPPESGPGDQPCNGCEGRGKRRPWDASYPFSVENVSEFAAFLRDSGGFKIW